MRIGELARSAQTRVDTIRFYERIGLLPRPERTASNYRVYFNVHAERFAFIRRCRNLDMSLKEIRTLLQFCDEPQQRCNVVNDMLDEHIDQVESRILELERLARELRKLRSACSAPSKMKHCQVLKKLRAN